MFCGTKGVVFPPDPSVCWIIADFLCVCADSCKRPSATLKTVSASITSIYTALGMASPMANCDIKSLISALVKSGTSQPMLKTKVMPAAPFYSLFRSWGDNRELSLSDLRLKAISLLSLTIMARPSDLAPLAYYFDPESGDSQLLGFRRSQVTFHTDGSITLRLLGTKNDFQRTGFEVRVPSASDSKTDVVAALRAYMDRTSNLASMAGDAVFLTLTSPYRGIKSTTVRSILCQAIELAGLGGQGLTAHSFRPTGANAALEAGVAPETVMQVGRWKTQDVFFQHYVYPRAPNHFSEDMANFSGIHY